MKRIVAGILAHVDAGKTTLSEALLYATGQVDAGINSDLTEIKTRKIHLAKFCIYKNPCNKNQQNKNFDSEKNSSSSSFL